MTLSLRASFFCVLGGKSHKTLRRSIQLEEKMKGVCRMSLGAVLGKRTWLGVALASAALLLWVMAGALLVTKCMLPVGMVDGWLYGGCVMAALLAGFVAGKGRGGRLLPLVTAVLLYAVLWVVALSSSQPLDFSGRGLWITAAMLGGGLLSSLLLGGKKKKKRGKRQISAAARRRKRAAA